MTQTTEEKAQAMVNGVLTGRGIRGFCIFDRQKGAVEEALCRAIEQRDAIQKEHDDYKQKVSNAAEEATEIIDHWSGDRDGAKCLQDFIIPKPKPDPLVAALEGVTFDHYAPNDAKTIRAALDKLGFEIKEKSK